MWPLWSLYVAGHYKPYWTVYSNGLNCLPTSKTVRHGNISFAAVGFWLQSMQLMWRKHSLTVYVRSLKKEELPNIFKYSSTEHEFPNLLFRKTFIPFIHVGVILCLLKYHDICEEWTSSYQFYKLENDPQIKYCCWLPNAYWRCLPWNIYSLKPSTRDPFPRPLISKVKKTLKVLILFRPCFWIFRKMQKTGTKTKLSSNNARSKVSTCPNQFVFLFLLFHKL